MNEGRNENETVFEKKKREKTTKRKRDDEREMKKKRIKIKRKGKIQREGTSQSGMRVFFCLVPQYPSSLISSLLLYHLLPFVSPTSFPSYRRNGLLDRSRSGCVLCVC